MTPTTPHHSQGRLAAGLLFAVTALSAAAQTYVSNDFSAASDWTRLEDVVMRNGNALASTLGTATWSSLAGSDGQPGRINFSVTAAQEFSYYYTTALTPGAGLVVSYDFLATAFTAGGLSRTAVSLSAIDPTLATASADLNLVQSTTMPQARLFKASADTTATFEARYADNSDADTGVTLTAGSWYTFTTTFTPDAEAGIYNISSRLIDFTTGQVVATATGDTKKTPTAAFFSNGEALDVYVGILGQGQYGGVAAIDNFKVTAAASPIPEPSTYALVFGAAILGVVVVRRRRRSA
ncbi:MAG TPA: PEP-CTERM sorting domain-containing protein [Opitutaceae bacterium]